MKYITNVCGDIDISGLAKPQKLEIRRLLEEFYTVQEMGDVFSDEKVTINDEWSEFNESDKFLSCMFKVTKLLPKETEYLIMCNGERDGDIWGIILKNNKVYTQRYELKPEGDTQEYEKVRFKK
ncbi:MAG: hypothetical protein U0354_10835 [Candidatus Sericytochromatia bacterium]